ncbi:MAG: hypothetical protein EZS28_044017, partial [Streblomastix strix]
KPNAICKDHPTHPLDYFCSTCQQPICSDCAILSDKHKGHNISGIIDERKRREVEMIQSREKISVRAEELKRIAQSLEKEEEEIRSQMQNASVNMEDKGKKLKEGVDNEQKLHVHDVDEQKRALERAAPIIVSGNESPPIGAQRTKQQTRRPSAQSRQQLGLVDTQGEENQFQASHGLAHSQQKRF